MPIAVHLDIVSLESLVFSGLVEQVIVRGALGELGVLAGHTPLLTALKPGPVRITLQGGQEEVFFVSGGTLEVQPDLITILADTVSRADDLDEAAALEIKQKTERLIRDKKTSVDFTQVLVQLSQATAQLNTILLARKLKKR